MAARSKAWAYGRSLAGIAGSNPAGGTDVCCACCVLSGGGLCDGPITRPKESYRVWCVLSVIEESYRGGLGPRAVEPRDVVIIPLNRDSCVSRALPERA